jgi:hypothetical protein
MPAMSRASLAAAAVLVATVAGHSTSLLAVLSLSKDVNAGRPADVTRTLPAGVSEPSRQQLPDGPGKELLGRLCAGCHDLMFTVSTRETEAGWTRIVNDMRSRGVDGTEEDFAKVIAYLTAHMGKAEPSARHAELELLANRTKVAPGERFALGLRLVAAGGWQLKGGAAPGGPPQVSWTLPQTVTIGEPARPVADVPATLKAFPAVVSPTVVRGSALDLSARVTYEVCRETCLTETAAASLTLPVGDGGLPSHADEFARAGVPSSPPR